MGSRNIFEKSGINLISTKEAMKDREEFVRDAVTQAYTPVKPATRGDQIAAAKAGLIPEAYINCQFDIEKIIENQREQLKFSPRKFMVQRFNDYKNVTTGIISTIIAHKIPDQSYIIGAPNGFGKTSFANTCILNLYAQGRLPITPYISLTDLAQIKLTNEKRLLSGLSPERHYKGTISTDAQLGEDFTQAFYDKFDSETYVKKPINLIDKFSWSEYMNCDILFCYFTDVGSKVIESEMLKTALTIRGAKGLPTIAMISSSLDPYKRDKYLAEYVWNEILAYNSAEPSYDRVKHISCYKDYNAPLRTLNREG